MKLKKTIGIVLSLLMVLTMIPILPIVAAANPFSDVQESDWFYDSVMYVNENGIMKGMSDDTFEPQTTMSRAMIVTVLHRIEGEPTASSSSFLDIPGDTWFTKPVAWAAADGIVNGYDADTFGPNDDVTREQIATILFRYAEKKGYDVSKRGELGEYTDENEISDWAKDALSWANGEGLVSGFPDNTLAPGANATRAQVAAILMRFCENIMETADTIFVTFDCNAPSGDTDFEPGKQRVKIGEPAMIPPYPTRDGYAFGGWYSDKECKDLFDFKTQIIESITLYARWNSIDSEEAQLSEQEAQQFCDSVGKIHEISAKFEDSEGYINGDTSNALNAVEKYVKELIEAGILTYYHRNDNNLYMEYASGILYMYIPSQRGTLSNSPPLSISTFSPYDSENGEMRNASTCGADVINNVLTTNIRPYRDDEIDLDSLSETISGDVLVWVGHGTYDSSLHSVLFIGETFDLPSIDAFKLRDSIKQVDFYSKGIVLAGLSSGQTHGTERLGITSKWIHKNASLNFNEGLIYLLACRGAQDETLVNTLINDSGAEVVFASQGTEDVGVGYANRMQEWIFKYMTGEGPDQTQNSLISAVNNPDGIFHTASDALDLTNQLLTTYSNELIRNGFQFNGNSFYDSDNDGDLDIQNCHIELFGNKDTDFRNYTLCGGITFSLDQSEKSDQLKIECEDDANQYKVEKHGDQYYVNKLEEGTYTLKYLDNGKTIKTIKEINVKNHRYTDLGKISLNISISGCIGQYNGKIYKIGKTVGELEGLPVEAAKYDYICSFAFYNDKVYYCCKDGGTSDYRMALYESNVDGTKQRELFAPDSTDYNLNLFAIKNGILYYRVAKWSGRTLQETFYMINLENGERTPVVVDIDADVREAITPDSTYKTCNGYKFYASKSSKNSFLNDCIVMEDQEGNVSTIVKTDGSLSFDGVVSDDSSNEVYIYYSTIIDYRDAVLYCMKLGSGEKRQVDSHMAAGGGVYFNW